MVTVADVALPYAIKPPAEELARRVDACPFCSHEWHGLSCRDQRGPLAAGPMWPSLRGHRCGCPSSFVEPDDPDDQPGGQPDGEELDEELVPVVQEPPC